jgi:hypothetical protein
MDGFSWLCGGSGDNSGGRSLRRPHSPTPGSAPSRWMRAPGRRWSSRHAQLTARLAWGSAWVDSGKVSTRENGEPLHPASITDWFHDLLATTDLAPVRLHDLRHGATPLVPRAAVTQLSRPGADTR